MPHVRVPQQLAVLLSTAAVTFVASSVMSPSPRKVTMRFAFAARGLIKSDAIALNMSTAAGSLRGPFALAPVGSPTELADELLPSHRSGPMVSGRNSRRW